MLALFTWNISLHISLSLLSLDICVEVPKTESFTARDLLASWENCYHFLLIWVGLVILFIPQNIFTPNSFLLSLVHNPRVFFVCLFYFYVSSKLESPHFFWVYRDSSGGLIITPFVWEVAYGKEKGHVSKTRNLICKTKEMWTTKKARKNHW